MKRHQGDSTSRIRIEHQKAMLAISGCFVVLNQSRLLKQICLQND